MTAGGLGLGNRLLLPFHYCWSCYRQAVFVNAALGLDWCSPTQFWQRDTFKLDQALNPLWDTSWTASTSEAVIIPGQAKVVSASPLVPRSKQKWTTPSSTLHESPLSLRPQIRVWCFGAVKDPTENRLDEGPCYSCNTKNNNNKKKKNITFLKPSISSLCHL